MTKPTVVKTKVYCQTKRVSITYIRTSGGSRIFLRSGRGGAKSPGGANSPGAGGTNSPGGCQLSRGGNSPGGANSPGGRQLSEEWGANSPRRGRQLSRGTTLRGRQLSRGSANSKSGCANLLFYKFLAKNCVKMKEFGPRVDPLRIRHCWSLESLWRLMLV